MYKYDYINYSEQFQDTASYFTTQGWNEYLDAFNQSGTLLAIKENMWVVSVQPQGLPEYTKEPIIEDNACTWELKVPLTISYYGKTSDQSRGDLYLKVSRTSVLRNQDGLAIKRTIFRPI
jgi:intracellular multiplication protein IcmL